MHLKREKLFMIQTKIIGFNDHGNIVLDINQRELAKEGILLGDAIKITLSSKEVLVNIPVLSGYYCKTHETLLLVSSECCELAVKRGNANSQYQFTLGDEFGIELGLSKKYWEQENAYSFCEINDGDLYANEEAFANFRPLFCGGTIFFRSASPFDDTYGRTEAVRFCIDKYSIRTIIDVADTRDELIELIGTDIQYCTKFSIYPIGSDAGLYSKEYEKTLTQAIEIIVRENGPFLIHCRAGKRRSGFLCALLQGLAGMSHSEIVADYMMSYVNNNGITQASDPQRFDYLKNDTIGNFLAYIRNDSDDSLPLCIENYLKVLGISPKTISQLTARLIKDKDPR